MTLSYKLIPKSHYFSGNVRKKLRDAETAGAINPIFLPNIEQLTEVQPIDVPIADIDTSFSSIWVPLRFFEDFIQDVLAVQAKVAYSEITSSWAVTPTANATSMANTSSYGLEWTGYTSYGNLHSYRLTAIELIELAMNFKVPAVGKRETALSDFTRDPNLTAGAIDKQRQLQERFTDWLRADPDRRQELERIYNQKFNSLKLPDLDGGHLTLPGMSERWRNRMRDYQLNGIYRGMLGNAGIFYEVGLGKTVTGQAIVMERKRIDPGIKAVLIVKKSTLRQFANGFREAYPQANILVTRPQDCEDGKRQLFMARIAAGNYDAVIMTQQQFERLPLRPETLRRHIEPMLERVRTALAEHGIECDEDSNDRKKRKSYVVKNLERLRNRLKEQIKNISAAKDRGLYFEDLGLNLIVADEADTYLNAPLMTKLEGIAGLSMEASGIATDFEWKVEWLRRTYGTGRLILMTGTFIRNTMANLYVMQRLMQPEMLEERGIFCFDAWASTFGRVCTAAEVTTDGKISRKSRFSEFVNLPELLQMFFSVAEMKRYEDVQDAGFTRPTAKYVNVLAPMSEDQIAVMEELVDRSTEIRSGRPREFLKWDKKTGRLKTVYDNLLWVSTIGRQVSLESRLVRKEAADFDKSKINQCVRRVFKIWRKTAAARSVQMIFLDLSTPASDPSVYRDVREKLVGLGIPIAEIAFMQDYESDEAKDALFDSLNQGIVRVILGSTSTMGVGVNAQKKLIALHHLDCPWRPCDLEQREGRILRSGNENSRVLIYRYVTQGKHGNCGFDSFMWQLVEAKSRFIQQIMRGDLTIRRMAEDASENPTFSAGEVKALATGDVRIMRHVEVLAQIEQLTRLERSINMDIDNLRYGSRSSIPYSRHKITKAQETLETRQPDFDLVRSRIASLKETFTIKLLEQEYTNRTAAGEVLAKCIHDLLDDEESYRSWRRIGFYGGFEVLLMAPDARSYTALLRGPSQDTYELRLVRDKYESAGRIEQAYEGVLWVESNAHRDIAYHQKQITELEAELERKQHQVADVRSQLSEFTLEKTQLEADLGIDKDGDRSMSVSEVGND